MEITHQFELNTSSDKVYETIATQSGMEGWWCKDCHIGTAPNEVSKMRFDKEGTIVEMHFRVDQLLVGKMVSMTCVENPNPSWIGTELIFEMTPKGSSTDFKFTHAGFDPKWAGQDPFEMTKGGWEHFMTSLKSYCNDGVGEPW